MALPIWVRKGWSLRTTDNGRLEWFVTDGFGCELRLTTSSAARVVSFVLDGAARVGSIVADGHFDHGGERAQAWTFIPADLGEVGGADLTIHDRWLQRLVVADRAWLTTEAVAAARTL